MEYAHAMGHGMGFGLGFLNFLGTILFFITVVWLLRTFIFGGRRYGRGGPWNAFGGGPGRGYGRRGRGGWSRWDEGSGEDDALKMAKERFAQGKISAEEFATIRSGLDDGSNNDKGERDFPDLNKLKDRFNSGWGRERAIDIARTRFAKGEINQEEFETLRKTLEG